MALQPRRAVSACARPRAGAVSSTGRFYPLCRNRRTGGELQFVPLPREMLLLLESEKSQKRGCSPATGAENGRDRGSSPGKPEKVNCPVTTAGVGEGMTLRARAGAWCGADTIRWQRKPTGRASENSLGGKDKGKQTRDPVI